MNKIFIAVLACSCLAFGIFVGSHAEQDRLYRRACIAHGGESPYAFACTFPGKPETSKGFRTMSWFCDNPADNWFLVAGNERSYTVRCD